MPMAENLVARLTADAGVAALVADRVAWFGKARGDGYPCVIISEIDPGRDYTHGGPDGLDGPRLQIDCYGRTDVEAVTLGRAVLACMEAPATIGSTKFYGAFLEGRQTIDDGEMMGGETLMRVSLDLTFYHEEI